MSENARGRKKILQNKEYSNINIKKEFPTNISNPSIKFTKLMTAVIINIRKTIKIKFINDISEKVVKQSELVFTKVKAVKT